MKNSKFASWLFAVLLAVLPLVDGVVVAQEDDGEPQGPTYDELRQENLQTLPPAIMSAARRVAPDVVFQSAVSYWEEDLRVYSLSGRLFREVWVVHVADTGEVLRVERDNQED